MLVKCMCVCCLLLPLKQPLLCFPRANLVFLQPTKYLHFAQLQYSQCIQTVDTILPAGTMRVVYQENLKLNLEQLIILYVVSSTGNQSLVLGILGDKVKLTIERISMYVKLQ